MRTRYRPLHTKIWQDTKFLRLNTGARFVFIHLLTNNAYTISGIYAVPFKSIVYETGFDRRTVRKAFEQLEINEMARYFDEDKEEIAWVINGLRYALKNSRRDEKFRESLKDDLRKLVKFPHILDAFLEHNRDLFADYGLEETYSDLKSRLQKYRSDLEKNKSQNEQAVKEGSVPDKRLSPSNGGQPVPDEPPKKQKPPSDEAIELARYFFECIRKNKSDFKRPDFTSWARVIDRMIRLDKRKPDKIKQVMKWCQEDNVPNGSGFCWAHNVLSVLKLRKKFDELELKMQSGKYDPKKSCKTELDVFDYGEDKNLVLE